MKRITNILSYLCLLLLLLVVACSDLEEIVVNMQGEEEVELTIQTNIPSLGGSTRTAPTENITSITALAFDSDKELIKVVTATLINPQGTSGTLSVKVPLRTRRIHFIAKNNDVFDEITDDDYGKSDVDLLKDLLTTELHYWAMLQFEDADDLDNLSDELAAEPNTDNKLTLIRNMAKVELSLPNGTSGYIAGFLNYNTEGTIAAYSGDDFQYLSANTSTHYVPATHTSDDEDDGNADSKPSVEYMFEETNTNGDYVYVICNIADKYYKIAFAYADANDETVYFPIVRNHSYTINIKDGYSTSYGKDSFEEAIVAAPINATAQEEVEFIFDSETIIMFIEDKTCEISVTIPEGITQLKVLPVSIFTIQSISPNLELGGDDLYTVTPGRKYTFTLKLDESHTETGKAPVRFIGEGVGKIAHKDVEVKLRKKATLIINPEEQTLINTQGSSCYVDVTIPANINNLVIEVGDAFTVTSVATLSSTPVSPNDDGSYTVTNTTYRVTLTLKDDAVGQIGEYPIHFAGTSEYWGAEGTATITLQEYVAPDLDVYEIWVNNGTWEASDEYSVEFFGYEGTFVTGGQVLGNNFYDALTVNSTTYSADNHKQQAMVMGSDDSFTFTIPEGSNRWLTLLVANDGDDSGTPSINLTGKLANGDSWTTAGDTEDLTNGTYNFGAEGEITSAGRLIRYELPAGTYTLQRGTADYLLYYMRVSKARPEMTDVAQPQLTDYNLSWSGATYTNTDATGHLPIGDDNKKHIVDEKNLTHTVSLKDGNSLTISGGESTFDLTVATTRVSFSSTDSNKYGSSTIDQYPETKNGSFDLQTYNAGNYTLKGTIEKPNYKYSAFYDKLLLEAVAYEVKSPIMPGLYTSMDGDKLTPVNEFSSLDEAWAIGFLMPKVVPDLEVSPENYTIDISIPGWTISTDGDARGLGVIDKGSGNYTLGTQKDNNNNEMIHPREGWTYKIKWASIAGEKISPRLTGEKASDTDHYFIYNGTIDKSVEIATPYTEQQLGVELNFRSAEDKGNDATYNLNFGSDFYLTAEISQGDAQNYVGKMVRLKVDFSNTQGGGNGAIHWSNSRIKDDSTIEYGNSDGTELQFEIKQGQTSYEIHWQFVRDDGTNTTTQFTYTIGGQNVSGETSATVVLNGNGQAVDNPNELNLPLEISLNFYRKYPDGRTDNKYDNLIFGVSRVGLKATISIPTDQKDEYYGKFVYLQGTFSDTNGTGNAGIHWDNSRDSGNDFEIAYKSGADRNGTQLQFQIENGKTEYDIEWVFKGGSLYNSSVSDGDVGFTYAVSATNSNYTVNGSNVSLNIQREANIFQGEHSLSWEEDGRYDINEILPQGANVTIGLSGEGVFKFVDHYWRIIKLPNIEYTTYDDNGDLHLDVTKLTDGTIAFEVSDQIVMRSVDYDNNLQLKSEENLSGSLNGLIIQGANTLKLNKITITAPSSAFNN